MDLKKINQKIKSFVKARDWDQFHSPKNLSMALSVEASELVEIFQWLKESDLKKIDKSKEAPVFGEHTKQILLENGFSSEEVDNLIKQSVVL